MSVQAQRPDGDGDARRPIAETVARPHHLGSVSARSTLLTILGEFVHPGNETVWTATLVAALAALDVEEKAARQTLTRTATEGLLTSSRHGRRVLWSLTEQGHDLLEKDTNRTYGFLRGRRPWNRQWFVLNVHIPESQRQTRHSLRTRLTRLGLGSPTPGLWISADTRHAEAVREIIVELGLEGQAFAWTGSATSLGDQRRLLGQAWDLEAVRERHATFIETFDGHEADGDEAAFAALIRLVQEWRRFPRIDPDLPAELLDDDWLGSRAATVFHDRQARWHLPARAAWDALDASSGPKPTS